VKKENEFDLNKEETRLREQLQRAVRSEEVPPYLAARIQAHIKTTPSRGFSWMPAWRPQFAAIAAALLVVAGGAIAYQLGHLRLTASSQASYIATVSNKVASIMRVGLGDHIHCAFFRKFPKTPPPAEQFVAKLGPEYAGLIPIVRKEVPAKYRLDLAHKCSWGDRKFVHLVLRNQDQLISLVLARKRPGESFETEGLLPALAQAGIPIYQASSGQNFQIATFESRDHLVYLISDLPKKQNLQHLLAMAPGLKEYLKKLEL
jgi:hypothetical protein